jgi:tRNA A-37 threonylcarbamoyl transferase component Bud32
MGCDFSSGRAYKSIVSQQQQPVDEVQPGSILAGKYRVERVLGQGGMGRVVEARHVALDDRVAMKFLLPEFAQHPEASARFLREARAAVRIKSEHVAKVTDVGTLESGAPYMVMEFLEGNDLSQQLERSGVLAVHDAVDFIIQAAEALAEAHSYGIVHRDIKPANMFLGKGLDGGPLVKVLDFGISKYNDGNSDNLTRTMAAMGSALYMSPEQMQQSKTVDHRTDIYALGITLYELLAGKQPFYAETLPQLCAEVLTGTPTPLRSVRNDLPQGLSEVLERAYARDRDQRYQTIAQLVLGLAPFAPPRSRNTVERIARMAGLDPNSAPTAAPQRISVPPEGQQIVVGGYNGPVSEKAAAAFAGQGAGALATGQTNMDLARTDPKAGAKPSGGKGATVALFAVMLLAGAAVAGYFFFLRPPGLERGGRSGRWRAGEDRAREDRAHEDRCVGRACEDRAHEGRCVGRAERGGERRAERGGERDAERGPVGGPSWAHQGPRQEARRGRRPRPPRPSRPLRPLARRRPRRRPRRPPSPASWRCEGAAARWACELPRRRAS